jgi:hypothetical protein
MFERELLDPEVITASIQEAVRRLQVGTNASERTKITTLLQETDEELRRLTIAIATGGNIPVLISAVEDRERQRQRLQADLDQLNIIEQSSGLDARQIEQDLRGRLVDWKGLLRANVQQARQAIRKLLVGRLALTPNEDKSEFTISGTGLLEPLLEQALALPKAGVTPAGFEPAISTLKGSRPWPG